MKKELLGNIEINKIYQMDCIEGMKLLPDNCIDLTVTSPPYDNLRDYKGYSFDFECVASELYRITKDGGVVVWVVADETKNFCESLSSFKQAIYFVEVCGFKLLDTMIYAKKSYAPAYPTMRRYAQTFEYMFVFVKGHKPKSFNPIKTEKEESSISKKEKTSTYRQRDGSMQIKRVKPDNLLKDECNVWVYDVGYMKSTKDKLAFEHPAVFPEALAQDHILSWSNPGDIILDPFMGSGTTAKMAILNNRKFIGFEISKEYVEIANERIKKYI
jgi:site-specific DNA-methyltransferase (adenine-specific)